MDDDTEVENKLAFIVFYKKNLTHPLDWRPDNNSFSVDKAKFENLVSVVKEKNNLRATKKLRNK